MYGRGVIVKVAALHHGKGDVWRVGEKSAGSRSRYDNDIET